MNIINCSAAISMALLASYPGLPSQLFSQPWQKATLFATAAKKAVREGLGTRLWPYINTFKYFNVSSVACVKTVMSLYEYLHVAN